MHRLSTPGVVPSQAIGENRVPRDRRNAVDLHRMRTALRRLDRGDLLMMLERAVRYFVWNDPWKVEVTAPTEYQREIITPSWGNAATPDAPVLQRPLVTLAR